MKNLLPFNKILSFSSQSLKKMINFLLLGYKDYMMFPLFPLRQSRNNDNYCPFDRCLKYYRDR